MNRDILTHFILETYSISPEFLWPRYPRYAVFRHPTNRKWFALIANVPRTKLGLLAENPASLLAENPASHPTKTSAALPSNPNLDIINLKLDPDLIDSLRGHPGIFPAYHMNKTHWLSLALDGSVAPDLLQSLLAHSFTLTQK